MVGLLEEGDWESDRKLGSGASKEGRRREVVEIQVEGLERRGGKRSEKKEGERLVRR